MGSYTMQVSELVEKELGESIDSHVTRIREWLFDFPYPFYNELDRESFEKDFIEYYYMREIGFESPFLFKLKLKNWLNINMIYWNEVFLSEGLIKNPLINVDWQEVRETERDITTNTKSVAEGETNDTANNTETGSQATDNFNRKLDSDTPDSRLQITTGNTGQGVIEYASNIEENKQIGLNQFTNVGSGVGTSKSKGETVDEGNSKDKFKDTFRVFGTQGVKTESEMVLLYRNTLRRLKVDIYKEMQNLFMLVY